VDKVFIAAFDSPQAFLDDPALASVFTPLDLEVPEERSSDTSYNDTQPRIDPAEVRSLSEIMSVLGEEPIEDGITHRAEIPLDAHLQRFGAVHIVQAVCESGHPARSAALLRLLGRLGNVGATGRMTLVEWGLSSPSVEIRDAAVQAVENWEDHAVADLLRGHAEPVAWLAQYAENVLRDLER
jgi:hypothetical protein